LDRLEPRSTSAEELSRHRRTGGRKRTCLNIRFWLQADMRRGAPKRPLCTLKQTSVPPAIGTLFAYSFRGFGACECHRMAAKGTEFPWQWTSGTYFTNLDVIWGMSVAMIRFRTFLAIVTIFGLVVFLISRGPQQNFERTDLPSVSRSDAEVPKLSRDVAAADTDEATPKVRPEMATVNGESDKISRLMEPYNHGTAHQQNGQYDQAIGLDPNHTQAYYSRGLIYHKENNRDQAFQDYSKAISIDSGYNELPYAKVPVDTKPKMEVSSLKSPQTADKTKTDPETTTNAGREICTLHFSSVRTDDATLADWTRLQGEFPTLLGQRELLIRSVDIEGQGKFLRVLTGSFSDRGNAKALCKEFESRKQYCAVLPLTDAR
jgi:hypothetical protein